MRKIAYEDVKRFFDYHPDGHLVWKFKPGRKIGKNIGDLAAALHKSTGYMDVYIRNVVFREHRLIWLWHHGYLPENDIDHIDKCKTNNRIENLREVSRSCNLKNTKQRKSISGIKGVYYNKIYKEWVAAISHNAKIFYVYIGKSFEEAVFHRLAVEQCLNAGCESLSPAMVASQKILKGGN